jgi:peptidylprolyl isomerase
MTMRKLAMPVLLLMMGLAVVACQKEAKLEGPQPIEMMPGLTYIDSTIGTGALVDSTSFVVVHYTGWLEDPEAGVGPLHKGNKFDSSLDRGEPIAFPLGRSMVIPGWDKGLVGMRVGGKRTLIISPELAYGDQGRPPVIPPKSTLIFDTEMMDLPEVQIEILEQGDGPVAEVGDNVAVNYTGWLWENGAKGEEFDSSSKAGRPFRFAVGRRMVIPGWDMAIEGMAVGTKARLIIPPILGYGKRGSPGSIPPDATLCFEVELVEIEGK